MKTQGTLPGAAAHTQGNSRIAAEAASEPEALRLSVNREPRSLTGVQTISDLMAKLGLGEGRGSAVAVAGRVIPKGEWPTHRLRDGDALTIVRAVQGG